MIELVVRFDGSPRDPPEPRATGLSATGGLDAHRIGKGFDPEPVANAIETGTKLAEHGVGGRATFRVGYESRLAAGVDPEVAEIAR